MATESFISLPSSAPDWQVLSGGPGGQTISTWTSETAARAVLRCLPAELNPFIVATVRRRDPCWITTEGQILAFEEIADDHLTNILKQISDARNCPSPEQWAALEAEAMRRCAATPPRPLFVKYGPGYLALHNARERWPVLNEMRAQQREERLPEDRLRAAFGMSRMLPRRAAEIERKTPIRCSQCEEFFTQKADENACSSCAARLLGIQQRAAAKASAAPVAPTAEEIATFVCEPCRRDGHEACIKRAVSTGLACTCTHDATSERFRRIEID